LYNELHNLYALPNIIWVIKSRWIWLGEARSTHGRDEKCIQYFDWKSRI